MVIGKKTMTIDENQFRGVKGQITSDHELFHTKHGRDWLRVWCSKTVFTADADRLLKRLDETEKEFQNGCR